MSTAARGAALSYNDRRTRVNGCGFKRPSCLFDTPDGCLVVLDNDHFQLHATAIPLPLNSPSPSHRSRGSVSSSSSSSTDALQASATGTSSGASSPLSYSPLAFTHAFTGQGDEIWANPAPQQTPSSIGLGPQFSLNQASLLGSALPMNAATNNQTTLLGPQLMELLNALLTLNLSNQIPPTEGLNDRLPSMRSRLRARRSLQMRTFKAWSGPTSITSPSLNQGATAVQLTNPSQHCHGATPDLQYLGTAGVDLCPQRLLTVRDHFRALNGSTITASNQVASGIADIEGRVFLVSSCDDGYLYLHSFAPASS